MIFYKSYPYAPKATLYSALSSIFAYFAIIFGAVNVYGGFFGDLSKGLFADANKIVVGVIGLLLLGLGLFSFFYLYKKVIPAKAEKESEENIRTKASFGYMYCKNFPEEYERIRAVNADFAEKYQRDETGKIVKVKKR